MTKLLQAQRKFLELLETGLNPREAAVAVGYSNGIAWYWAEKNPLFASKFKKAWPSFGQRNRKQNHNDDAVIAEAPVLTACQLAMQRLERELRADGPYAVLAAAAIVLVSPYAAAEESPAVETDEPPADTLSPQAQPMVARLTTNDLYRMFHEVYPIGELPAIPADACKIRQHIEAYFNCSLPTMLDMSARSIGGHLRVIAACSFPVAFESGGHSHLGKIYMVPQPKTRAQ